MQKIFKIDLDIKNPQLKSVPPIEVVSGDTSTNIFNINLLEDFKEVNATGNTVVIIFGKPDNTTVFQNLTVADATKGQYTCTLSSQTIAVPGRIKAEIALYEGIKRLTSTRFEFNVRKAILDENTVESSNEFSALTQALSEVADLKNLAGEGRTTETVKGNADDLATHKAEIATSSKLGHIKTDPFFRLSNGVPMTNYRNATNTLLGNSVDPQTDLAAIPDNAFYEAFVDGKTGYPASYGSIYGFRKLAAGYTYSWQIFHGTNASVMYRRYAKSATEWSSWKAIQEV